MIGYLCLTNRGTESMIAEAVARIQAIEQNLIGKTHIHLQARLAIRSCLQELLDISSRSQPATASVDGKLLGTH
jgi:hypothetical protein